ncbi:hypothetical protein M427DRAFT_53914 [Gonapodya prolifera JEL478]|uniref:Uncharacterized protein n=1 Tax=Gonapodya prolifera (strain JEL478) TaxID=1344416 RepID=A0A139ANG0_GONPJ|nr:hypothetical protein M427DRAFT_53914 [Gonapodya prolifera JEL478]|eukprot:KXS18063.1 hypothetical protein M427DRAFT_53914 [Gonapodya prolifera JEL478]
MIPNESSASVTVASDPNPNDSSLLPTTPEHAGYATEWTEDSPLRQSEAESDKPSGSLKRKRVDDTNAALSCDSSKKSRSHCSRNFLRKGPRFQSSLQRGFGPLRRSDVPLLPVFLATALLCHSQTAGIITSRDRAVQVTLWKLWICFLSMITIRTLVFPDNRGW